MQGPMLSSGSQHLTGQQIKCPTVERNALYVYRHGIVLCVHATLINHSVLLLTRLHTQKLSQIFSTRLKSKQLKALS